MDLCLSMPVPFIHQFSQKVSMAVALYISDWLRTCDRTSDGLDMFGYVWICLDVEKWLDGSTFQ